jgi:thioredoxin-like negative regulator of GroEL
VKEFNEKIYNVSGVNTGFSGLVPALILFYIPCSFMKSTVDMLENISQKYTGKLNLYGVDVSDAGYELAEMLGIRALPSLLIISMTGEPMFLMGRMETSKMLENILSKLGIGSKIIL